jgi:hypothetical protein
MPIHTKDEDNHNFIQLFSSLNQGDIGLLKSILDDSEVEYYVTGENFLALRPLLTPAVFYIKESEVEKVKEILKDIDFNILGTSANK